MRQTRSLEFPRLSAGRNHVIGALLLSVVVGCSAPTLGPKVRIGPDGWSAEPISTVQAGDWFEFDVINSLDGEIRFVVLELDYGSATDLPLVNGVVDVNRQVLYEPDDPSVAGVPVVAYRLVHPGPADGSKWEPAVLDPGATETVRVGNPGLGGGEPGRFVVVSYERGALERGDFAAFDMTDENGDVPQFTLEDFYPSEEAQP